MSSQRRSRMNVGLIFTCRGLIQLTITGCDAIEIPPCWGLTSPECPLHPKPWPHTPDPTPLRPSTAMLHAQHKAETLGACSSKEAIGHSNLTFPVLDELAPFGPSPLDECQNLQRDVTDVSLQVLPTSGRDSFQCFVSCTYYEERPDVH